MNVTFGEIRMGGLCEEVEVFIDDSAAGMLVCVPVIDGLGCKWRINSMVQIRDGISISKDEFDFHADLQDAQEKLSRLIRKKASGRSIGGY